MKVVQMKLQNLAFSCPTHKVVWIHSCSYSRAGLTLRGPMPSYNGGPCQHFFWTSGCNDDKVSC